jgi:hypothetical protein
VPSIARQKVVRHAFLIVFDEILDKERCASGGWAAGSAASSVIKPQP